MELIHITTQEEYNVVIKSLEHTRGFKPARPAAIIKGDRYVSVEDNFLPYFLSDTEDKRFHIIEFEDFLKEAI
jgi:hypothetical protein